MKSRVFDEDIYLKHNKIANCTALITDEKKQFLFFLPVKSYEIVGVGKELKDDLSRRDW